MLEKRKACNRIHEKGYRDHPLSEKQKERNRNKSLVRTRIEPVFAFMMSNTMRGLRIRSIGIERARANIGMINLMYNISRYALLQGA